MIQGPLIMGHVYVVLLAVALVFAGFWWQGIRMSAAQRVYARRDRQRKLAERLWEEIQEIKSYQDYQLALGRISKRHQLDAMKALKFTDEEIYWLEYRRREVLDLMAKEHSGPAATT